MKVRLRRGRSDDEGRLAMTPLRTLLLAAAYFSRADAHFGVQTALNGRAHRHRHRRSIGATAHRRAAVIDSLRGGSVGTEENPDYVEPDTSDKDSDDDDDYDASDEDDDDVDSEVEHEGDDVFADELDDSGTEYNDREGDEKSKVSTKKLSGWRSSGLHRRLSGGKSRKSLNKRLLKFARRNQLNFYLLLAAIAFRREIFSFAMQILPTKVDPKTGKLRISINWGTDILKLLVIGMLVTEMLVTEGPRIIRNRWNYEDENEPVNGKEKNQTQSQSLDRSTSSPSPKPIFPLLLLLLVLVPMMSKNFRSVSYFILPIAMKLLSGEANPDSPLGRLMLTMFSPGDTDIATQMAYLPPLEQHYTFEQLNERYARDWGAWGKAFPVNSLVGPDQETVGAAGGNGADNADGSGKLMLSSLIRYSHKSSPSKTTSIGATFPTGSYPRQYNNGTAIVLDMTKLDVKVSKMDVIRDQISFILHLVQAGGSNVFSPQTPSSVPANATNVSTTGEAMASTNCTTACTTDTEINTDQAPASPVVEVIVLLESPGGGVSQYGLASSHLQRLRSSPNVKLTICIDNIATSGGYMMACMSSPGQLYCAPFAMVGSIGVISQSFNVQKTLEGYGIRPYVFRGGKTKNPVGLVGDITKEGVSSMQDTIDKIHDSFRDHVLDARREAFAQAILSDKDAFLKQPVGNYFQLGTQSTATTSSSPSIQHVLDEVASGDVFLGVQALKLGLVDRIITSDEYIAERIQHGCRVLKLIDCDRQMGTLSSLFQSPGPRRASLYTVNRNGGDDCMKRIVDQVASALLAMKDCLLARTVHPLC